jgi:hypothetical protein
VVLDETVLVVGLLLLLLADLLLAVSTTDFEVLWITVGTCLLSGLWEDEFVPDR